MGRNTRITKFLLRLPLYILYLELNKIYQGDSLTVLKTFPSESIDCIVTSPPYYGLRDYGIENQIGQEKTPQEYIANLMAIMNECKRVLKKSGSLWVLLSLIKNNI